MKSTLVIGASSNPERYSFKAVEKLQQHGCTVIPVGIKSGKINDLDIFLGKPMIANIHTVSLYVGAANQTEWIPYILALIPNRIIFNPGTENLDFITQARERGIECLEACTLVMLSIGNY
jgi:uncharacterized protein